MIKITYLQYLLANEEPNTSLINPINLHSKKILGWVKYGQTQMLG